MIGEILRFLLDIGFTLIGAVLLARAWLQAVKLHPFNPISQAIYQATNWLVGPLRRIVPTGGGIDWATLLGAVLAAIVYLVLLWFVSTASMLPVKLIPGIIGAGFATVGRWALNLIIWLTLIQAILSWINPMATIMPVLRTMTEPLLEPIRRIMPRLGGIDLSPLVLLILAQIAIMVVTRIIYQLFPLIVL
ncbi:YggT family protein [Zwartia vadi]|uniref:YggT family protein n=1 Tax=Zwartia vadi TaxID=3058168 RepID=UPI0025B2EFE5|nr:YggT family protein [Zwartia vadi]MDN3986182.1 YggT family protein [Zwartia vadi]